MTSMADFRSFVGKVDAANVPGLGVSITVDSMKSSYSRLTKLIQK